MYDCQDEMDLLIIQSYYAGVSSQRLSAARLPTFMPTIVSASESLSKEQ